MRLSRMWFWMGAPLLVACSSGPIEMIHTDEPGETCGAALGCGSFELVVVHEPEEPHRAVDLQFNPSLPSQLWVLRYDEDDFTIIDHPGTPEASVEDVRDPTAKHFMHRPPAVAFGAVSKEWGQTFGICGDNDNSHWGTVGFMGPSLFSADLAVFALETPDGLGSHLDMLHSTSFCRGIAHVRDNRYFVFNAGVGSIDEYDFHHDHGPGNDEHADGEIYRWVFGEVAGKEGTPSHLAYSGADEILYIADTGNGRVVALDVTTGTMGTSFPGMEPVVARRFIEGAVVTELVPPGLLEAPSGIALRDSLLHVTDNATGRIQVFDRDGVLVQQLDTGLPPGSLAGLTFGPKDDKLYFTDMLSGRVYRIDPGF